MKITLLTFVALIHGLSASAGIIDGYTDKISVYPGEKINIYLNSDIQHENYPLALYNVAGEKIFEILCTVFPQKPAHDKPYENGFGYQSTVSFKVPQLTSGLYFFESQIPLIIKAKHADITVVFEGNTLNAYSNSGGKSLYGYNSTDKIQAHQVSFLRPLNGVCYSYGFFNWIYQQQIPNVGYIVDQDLDTYSSFSKSQLLIITGHSEYWTYEARKNFDQFVQEGKNALILSGNSMWYQIRYGKDKKSFTCYKNTELDPAKIVTQKTVSWSDPMLEYPIEPSIGVSFDNAGYGLKNDRGWNGFKIVAESPLLEGTSLKTGDILPCPSDELDGVPLISKENLVIDRSKFPMAKIEIVAYDITIRGTREGVGTWIIYQPNPSAGIIINTASTDWCSTRGIGTNRDIQKITGNMIQKLMNRKPVFSGDDDTIQH